MGWGGDVYVCVWWGGGVHVVFIAPDAHRVYITQLYMYEDVNSR